MTLFETQDERRRRLQAAGVLQDGESMRFGMMFADSAGPTHAAQLKDATMTANINDAMQQIPSDFRSKMRYEIIRMQDADPFIARQGIDGASTLRFRMAMMTQGMGAPALGMVTDSDKTVLQQCMDHLDAHAEAAHARIRAAGR